MIAYLMNKATFVDCHSNVMRFLRNSDPSISPMQLGNNGLESPSHKNILKKPTAGVFTLHCDFASKFSRLGFLRIAQFIKFKGLW